MGKTETIKKRTIYVYLPSIEQKLSWEEYAKEQGTSISKFVIEHVENSLKKEEDSSYVSGIEMWKQVRELREQLDKVLKEKRVLEIAFDRLEEELRRYRAQPFLEDNFSGLRRYQTGLVDVLKNRVVVSSDEILRQLSVDPTENEAVKAISIQLENRGGYLKALEPYLDDLDIFVVSESLGVVPYCYSDTYPVTSYDYDPYSFFINHLSNLKAQNSREVFVERVSKWLTKYHPKYRKKILMLPKSWHLKIYRNAVKKASLNWGEYEIVSLTGRAHMCTEYMRKQLAEYF